MPWIATPDPEPAGASPGSLLSLEENMETFTRPTLVLLALLLAAFLPAATVDASLILTSPDETSGTGLGAVNTVLTVDATGSTDESGCVAYNGTMDVVGPAACPAGIPGGDERPRRRPAASPRSA